MFTKTALLAVGLMVVGSASLAAQQSTTPPKKTEHEKPTVVTPGPGVRSPINTWSADQIREAQLALTDLKLYDGKASGVMNPDTEQALKRFQRSHHMAATGKLSDSVMVLLRDASGSPMHMMHMKQ